MTTATTTKERPILMNAAMVRAALADRKTQTRRIVKPQYACKTVSWGCIAGQGFGFVFTGHDVVVKCPFGKVGDRLWVRESFFIESFGAGVAQIRYRADNAREKNQGVSDRKLPDRIGPVSSIHMPRHCSRITLEIIGVKVERLHDITRTHNRDIEAEGYDPDCGVPPLKWFADLWDLINGPNAWHRNDWVWAIEFKRLEQS